MTNDRLTEWVMHAYANATDAAIAATRAYHGIDDLAHALIDCGADLPALLIDGSMYSPSTRAIDGAEHFFQSNEQAFDTFVCVFDALTEGYCVMSTYDADYTMGWEDGCLWLYSTDDPEEDE